MLGFPYDDLTSGCGPYPPEVLAGQFDRVASGWMEGVTLWDQLHGEAALNDRRLIRAAGLHFASSANQVRFILARQGGPP